MRFDIGRSGRRGATRERGQVLVEFAFVAIAFLTLVFGIMDFGNALRVNIQLQNAVRDGARFASIHDTDTYGSCIGCTGHLATDVLAQVTLTGRAQNLGLTSGGANTNCTNCIYICYSIAGVSSSTCPAYTSPGNGGPCQTNCGNGDNADTCVTGVVQPEVSVTANYTLSSVSGLFPKIPFGTIHPSWTLLDEC